MGPTGGGGCGGMGVGMSTSDDEVSESDVELSDVDICRTLGNNTVDSKGGRIPDINEKPKIVPI